MKYRLGVFATAILIVAIFVADPSKAAMDSGNSIWSYCQKKISSKLICAGYIHGVADAIFNLGELGQPFVLWRACYQNGITNGQIKDVVVQFLRDNPSLRNGPAPLLIAEALSKAWPCSKNK